MQASTSQSRPYQGYPYNNPYVVDAPSIDAATAARWSNLPRRQISRPGRTDEGQVVYVNIPDGAEPSGSETQDPGPGSPQPSLPAKKEPDDTPVIYIDLPEEAGGSEVSQNREDSEETEEPNFVQDTIFYDPFENRRIDVAKGDETVRSTGSVQSESDADSTSTTTLSVRRPAPAPPRPVTLDLVGSASGASSNSNMPSTDTRPNNGYHCRQDTPETTFPSPLPVSGFPEPPPAYTEVETVSTPQQPVVEQPRPQDPPRTQVILPEPARTPIGLPNLDRKYLNCHHCGMRVHTLVVREIGPITHFTALLCFVICMLPIVALVYCMDCLKYKNHYCPNCNKKIGYEIPFSDKKVVYVN